MKSIVHILPSRNVDMETQLIDSCVSAMRELFFHLSEKEFEDRRLKFIDALSDHTFAEKATLSNYFPTFLEIQNSVYPPLGLGCLNLVTTLWWISSFSFLSPINVLAEESIKYFLNGTCLQYYFGIFEFIYYLYNFHKCFGISLPFVMIRIPALFMHIWTSRMTYLEALVFHYIFNCIMIIIEWNFDLPRVLRGDIAQSYSDSEIFSSLSLETLPDELMWLDDVDLSSDDDFNNSSVHFIYGDDEIEVSSDNPELHRDLDLDSLSSWFSPVSLLQNRMYNCAHMQNWSTFFTSLDVLELHDDRITSHLLNETGAFEWILNNFNNDNSSAMCQSLSCMLEMTFEEYLMQVRVKGFVPLLLEGPTTNLIYS